jgi:hypothetical protein
MKFKTEQAKQAYEKLIDEVSERATRMYEDVKQQTDITTDVRFSMNLAVEQFQIEGVARAIQIATQVDTAWAGLSGSLAVAMEHR